MSRRDRYRKHSREPGGFVALPWSVLDSEAYQRLSHPAKALLLEVARQYHSDDNGRMLLSNRYLATRGWRSADVSSRAKRELLNAGLIFETVKGARPNKASWYAITWQSLDPHPGYDAGVQQAFVRGAYRLKNGVLNPSGGIAEAAIAPSHGIAKRSTTPPGGTIKGILAPSSIPSDGNPLDMPSPGCVCGLSCSCLSRWEDDGGAFRDYKNAGRRARTT